MLDARAGTESVSLEHFDTGNHTAELLKNHQASASDQDNGTGPVESPGRRPQRKVITEDEIVGQALIFLLAGYETTSNTLAFTCYLLTLHPECLKKVQEEVDDFFSRHVSLLPLVKLPGLGFDH